ncbi:LOG family protein [Streptomyces acidiscabies]|uniref:LOG family protein n=1 Tax=Streptomyces acidiscabies TaxID=42234 RepID=A0AAP6BII8_9ACTN|nr:LOG family protein [Streptomyces acidiscabies]MBP5939054.1 DNA transporter [Streptomyces sp. LBUM 1476]MBZ3910167.1 LOG family protein [Streptomyces acidiscabies]MDX2965396.1 LOG family protein [Streptomyces acidiscabies]MDX3023660.1 LOG family protein [Streptomyces acidiscabies]MDX3789738.1 LOG family protein [Streptomyces acidiscabies]
MTRRTTAAFFGGVVPASPDEEQLAEDIGAALARAGFTLLHGGYNGLMEAAARGAASEGGTAVAVTLADKHAAWGEFNPYVTDEVHLPGLGTRLDHYLDSADLVVAMGGGVGTLHELAAALYYASTIRPVPVWVTGPTALGLLAFLKREKWLFETPTRPLGFLSTIASATAFAAQLHDLTDRKGTGT